MSGGLIKVLDPMEGALDPRGGRKFYSFSAENGFGRSDAPLIILYVEFLHDMFLHLLVMRENVLLG